MQSGILLAVILGCEPRLTEKHIEEIIAMNKVGKDHNYTASALSPTIASDLSIEAYRAFIGAKVSVSADYGFAIHPSEINPVCKPHQVDSICWAVRGGRRAIFAAFGLGKSIMQLEALRLILKHAGGGRALIVAPLGVRQEFKRDAREKLGFDVHYVRSMDDVRQQELFGDCSGIFITNYETVRDGKLDPSNFTATSLDEAAVLRSFGGTKTFREFMRLFETVKYRFVATATPDPNEYIEMLAYSAYLGIMDVSGAKTRFFKRDSTKADKLTLHANKEQEFWLWVASWALFLQRPSDLGHSDEGYALPPMEVFYHEITAELQIGSIVEVNGQMRMFADASLGVSQAAKEKRDTLSLRIAKMTEIVHANPGEHFILWHDLEAERTAIERAIPLSVSVYGAQKLEDREEIIIDFSDGKLQYLASKPVMLGAGCNFQRHCSQAVFVGIGFKFNDFIQALHRIHRFLQTKSVKVHLIFADTERGILENLLSKWKRYEERAKKMSGIIKEFGLSQQAMIQSMQRAIGTQRIEVSGQNYRLINNDAVEEARALPVDSVGLILTSIPFSTQYEYSPNYNDFGHSESNQQFFKQMDYLTPHLFRALQPGRICAIHVKDRIVPGGMTGLGFQTVYPFHADVIVHYTRHGFGYIGMKTIATDVVRENNQTYRLGWTEQCKDGSKMGVGMPEYLLLFRKPPSDLTNSYADIPVFKDKGGTMYSCAQCGYESDKHTRFSNNRQNGGVKQCPKCKAIIQPESQWKAGYSRSRWQIDAHGFARSSGNRPLLPEELSTLPHHIIYKLFKKYSLEHVYDFEYHVRLGEELERKSRLPVTFMLLQPQSWSSDIWSDIVRMRTLNGAQAAKGKQAHLCPMQFDLADRVIAQMTNPGDVVLDPFAGLGTVPMSAVKQGRFGLGVELSSAYFIDSCYYVEAACKQVETPNLFDVVEEPEEEMEIGEEAAIS